MVAYMKLKVGVGSELMLIGEERCVPLLFGAEGKGDPIATM